MEIHTATYVGSYPSEAKCPKEERPEYAFIGRSNVGKSSLINMLCERKDLAHVSNTPGKTQLLNYYLIDETWFLVDLPGYGYAQISKKTRRRWEQMIKGYFRQRANLLCAFVLIDSNIPPQKIDLEFINWLGENQVPFVLVFTKCDRIKPLKLNENLDAFRTALLEHWNALPQQFQTSARSGQGREEILSFIESVNVDYEQ